MVGEVFAGGILSTFLYVPAAWATLSLGAAAGAAMHGVQMWGFWFLMMLLAPVFVIMAPMAHWWLVVLWPGILIPVVKGVYEERVWVRLVILALLFVQGGVAGFFV